MPTEDYTEVTEVPGSGATGEQLERLYHRYHTAKHYAEGRRVLEVACGAGFGLGYMAQNARKVVGGDYTRNLLHIAHRYYQERIPLLCLDGQHLPFQDDSFDLILIFEAIYYLEDARLFVEEARRLLAPGGMLFIISANREWDEFGSSPFSTRYFSAAEFRDLMTECGFSDLEFYGAFPTGATSLKHHVVSLIRRMVVALDLMPKTLEGRARFKKIFYGKLTPMPAEIGEGMSEFEPAVPIDPRAPVKDFKVLYAMGRPAD